MTVSIRDRLDHILEAIGNIRTLLAGKTASIIGQDPFVRAALERFLEIISEASRHIPTDFKELYPDIPWIDIAAIGNRLRPWLR